MTTTQYLKSIRNSEKLRYATLYVESVVSGTAQPDVRDFDMRNWSAQDVRIRVDATLAS